MEYQYLGIVLLSLLFLALFSGLVSAFISADRLHIELQSKMGTLNGKILANLMNRPSQFMGTTLIGNTLSLVVYGIVMTYLFEALTVGLRPEGLKSSGTVLFIQVARSALLVLIVAEYVPKSFFRLNPNALLSFLTV